MSMTYNSLVADIQSYLQRVDADTIAKIPTFIFLAEHQIAVDVKSLGQEQYVNGQFVAGVDGGAVIAKPGRWRRTITFNFGQGTDYAERTTLKLRSYEFIVENFPNRNVQGIPEFYADYGFTHWLVAPTPNDAYPFEIAYMELIQPLSVNVQTNWLTNYAPQLLLYGSLLQAQTFVRNPEMIPIWQSFYDRTKDALNAQDTQRLIDRATQRDAD